MGLTVAGFPWGDQFDAAFCVMMDSHVGDPEIKSVHENVFDTSVYGVKKHGRQYA